MPSATKNLFEKRFLDLQKLLFINQKFLGVQNPFFKKGFGRRRHHAARGPYREIQ